MWSRAQLKEKAKYALHQNYWKAVLVALILVAIGGGAGFTLQNEMQIESSQQTDFEDIFKNEDFWSDEDIIYDDLYGDIPEGMPEFNEMPEFSTVTMMMAGMVLVVVLVVLVIAFIVGVAVEAILLNPLSVGINRFFYKNLNEKAEVKEVTYAFDHSYKNVVNVMFFRSLYTILWTLLFIIPGIVKSYEYRMIPYLMAENPTLSKEQAFALSKQMMNGQKWEAFVLDLSFIGWDILSVFTVGILSVFYVNPYRYLTNAALYEELSLAYGRPAFSSQTNRVTYDTEQ